MFSQHIQYNQLLNLAKLQQILFDLNWSGE